MTSATKTITIANQLNVNLDEILSSFNTLNTNELEGFMFEIGKMVASRKINHLENKESQLLKAINNGISTVQLERYKLLSLKNQEEKITETEHQELLQLNEKIEQKNVTRLKKMVALARIRGIGLPILMKQLGIANGVS